MPAGQSQKEFFVNQALVIVDALAHGAVTATLSGPPAAASDGDCYRIASAPIGEWSGHADAIAIRFGESWHFVEPADGMVLFDRSAAQLVWFRDGWRSAAQVAAPAGGTVIDLEARARIAELLQMLQSFGLQPPSAA